MKWLSAGVTFVNASAVTALLLGIVLQGLSRGIAICAFLTGLLLAAIAYWQTTETRLMVAGHAESESAGSRSRQYRSVWFWLLAGCFALFAFRSFCWLIYLEGNDLKVQSPNNLGDLGLHITYIKTFASGLPLWPDNPIYLASKMRYPAGTDLFNALLLLVGVDLMPGLIWAGLVGSLATFYALYRWGGSFGIAGFLFNGGVAGFTILTTWQFLDYQGDKGVAWKSLPLSMLVTQRGLLYALPAGLLLLYHWRAKYFPRGATSQVADSTPRKLETRAIGPLPFWVELTLYASMPLFHVHTFMALSILAACFFVIGDSTIRRQLATLVGVAFLPATLFMWTITDHFQASSVLKWKPGWVQTGSGDMAMPFFTFWLYNFGALVPLALGLLGTVGYRVWSSASPRSSESGGVAPAEKKKSAQASTVPGPLERSSTFELARFRSSPALVFLVPALLIFLFACFVKTAPWEWDNLKLIIWAYLIMLPFLWSELIARWPVPVRAGVCVALFASGFVSLIGGLVHNPKGYGFAERTELDAVGAAVRKLPHEARFAAYPTYNHPLLLQGRRVVMGYPGHLWTQGFDYAPVEKQLSAVMRGAPDWREQARALGVRYVFFGRQEKANYATGTRAWEREARLIADGTWGSIYDVEAAPPVPVRASQ